MATFVMVDDSAVARSFLRNVISEIGHKIIGEAENGDEGYELYKKLKPDLVTLDITMPVMNGIECLKKIKKDFPEAKIIMVTSIGKESKRAEAIKEGALYYINKPFNQEEVISVIDKCLKA